MRADEEPRPLVSLAEAADDNQVTPSGMLHILRRINAAVRRDGHWYATAETVDRIKRARQDLGLASRRGVGGRRIVV
jgi:hypothetical protein